MTVEIDERGDRARIAPTPLSPGSAGSTGSTDADAGAGPGMTAGDNRRAPPMPAHYSCPVASLVQRESAVIEHAPASVWRRLRALALDVVVPHAVRSVVWHPPLGETGPCIGSTATVTYADNSTCRMRITSVGEESHLEYEVVESNPALSCDAVTGAIRLQRVTETGHTFATWESAFHYRCSDDGGEANVMRGRLVEEQRHAKLDAFEGLRALLARG